MGKGTADPDLTWSQPPLSITGCLRWCRRGARKPLFSGKCTQALKLLWSLPDPCGLLPQGDNPLLLHNLQTGREGCPKFTLRHRAGERACESREGFGTVSVGTEPEGAGMEVGLRLKSSQPILCAPNCLQ